MGTKLHYHPLSTYSRRVPHRLRREADSAPPDPLALGRLRCRLHNERAAFHESINDARRPAARNAMAVAPLREVLARCAARVRRACDPLGR